MTAGSGGNPARGVRIVGQKSVPPAESSAGLDVTEEYAFCSEGCPTCGVTLGGSLSEPETSTDPAALTRQASNLRRLRERLIAGDIKPARVRERLPDLCPVCRSTMDAGAADGDVDAVASALSYQADLLDDRAQALLASAGPPGRTAS